LRHLKLDHIAGLTAKSLPSLTQLLRNRQLQSIHLQIGNSPTLLLSSSPSSESKNDDGREDNSWEEDKAEECERTSREIHAFFMAIRDCPALQHLQLHSVGFSPTTLVALFRSLQRRGRQEEQSCRHHHHRSLWVMETIDVADDCLWANDDTVVQALGEFLRYVPCRRLSLAETTVARYLGTRHAAAFRGTVTRAVRANPHPTELTLTSGGRSLLLSTAVTTTNTTMLLLLPWILERRNPSLHTMQRLLSLSTTNDKDNNNPASVDTAPGSHNNQNDKGMPMALWPRILSRLDETGGPDVAWFLLQERRDELLWAPNLQ